MREVLRLSEEGKWDSAWSLTRSAEKIVPDDTALQALWPRFAQLLDDRVHVLGDFFR